MQINKHPSGLVIFDGAAEIDQDFLDGWIERRSEITAGLTGKNDRRVKNIEDYTIDEDGNYVNRGGYKFTPEQFKTTPLRLVGLLYDATPEDTAFVNYLDGVMAKCLEEYIRIYPEVKTSIWYRTPSHAAVYTEGQEIGPHSDQAVERRGSNSKYWGLGNADQDSKPVNEFPTRTVVTASIVLRDCEEGGELKFAHAGVTEKAATGTAVFYPASYVGSHQVLTITKGSRVSYLQFYCHGTPIEGQQETHVDSWYNKDGKWVPPLISAQVAPL